MNQFYINVAQVVHSFNLSKVNTESGSLIIAIEDTFKIDGDVLCCRLQVESCREKNEVVSIKLHYYDNETLTMLLRFFCFAIID